MSLYTIVFIIITVLLLLGLSLFAFIMMKIDKWVDKKDRVGNESIYKPIKKDKQKPPQDKE